MKRILKSMADIRKGEGALAALMFANYYVLLMTYYFLKPVRDDLFITRVSPSMLPLVYIIIAVVAAPVITSYAKATKKFRLDHLNYLTIGVLIINLFIFRWLVQINQPWVYYTFYTWVSIYGVLTVSQYWLLANSVFDSTQAKRLFVILAVGGILGAWTGGNIVSILSDNFNIATGNLIYCCMGFLLISAFLVMLIWKRKSPLDAKPQRAIMQQSPAAEKMLRIARSIFRSRHLTLLVSMVAITVVVAAIVDWQFKTVVDQAIDAKERTAFFGRFYAWLNVAAFVLQIALSYRFVKFLGVAGTLLLFPLGILLGSLAMLFYPGLNSGMLLRGTESSLRYSIDKTGKELLFLPISLELRKRTKVFIDVFVDRWFRGIAGALILVYEFVFGPKLSKLTQVSMMSLVSIALLAIAIALILSMRREYVHSFRRAIQKREFDYSLATVNLDDRHAVKVLMDSLESPNERQLEYSLDTLKSMRNINITPPILNSLKHYSPDIRLKALEVLLAHGDISHTEYVKPLLGDDHIDVRSRAISFIVGHNGKEADSILKGFLQSEDRATVNAALAHIASHSAEREMELVNDDFIMSMLNDDSPYAEEGRIQTARFLGNANKVQYYSYIDQLLSDPSDKVIQEAIRSIGKLGRRDHIPWLVGRLSDGKLRVTARLALANYGPGILGTLSDYLCDDKIDFNIRKNIPKVIRLIPCQQAVDTATYCLGRVNPALKYYLVKALNSLRSAYPELKFDQKRIENVLLDDAKEYYEIYQILFSQTKSESAPGAQLLKKALEEKLQTCFERIFRVMGLLYPPKDIFYAYLGYVSGQRQLHANSIEFLDNLLRRDIKKYIFPILDDVSAETVIRKGEELFRLKYGSRQEALMRLFNDPDPWIRSCAIYSINKKDDERILKHIESVQSDSEPLIRETAAVVLARLNA